MTFANSQFCGCCGGEPAATCSGCTSVPLTVTCTYRTAYNSIAAGGFGHSVTYTTTFTMDYVPAGTIPWMRNNGSVYTGAYWAGRFNEYPIADDAFRPDEFCKYLFGRMYMLCTGTGITVEAHHYMTAADYPATPYKTTLGPGGGTSCLLGTLTNTTASVYGGVLALASCSPFHATSTGFIALDITA